MYDLPFWSFGCVTDPGQNAHLKSIRGRKKDVNIGAYAYKMKNRWYRFSRMWNISQASLSAQQLTMRRWKQTWIRSSHVTIGSDPWQGRNSSLSDLTWRSWTGVRKGAAQHGAAWLSYSDTIYRKCKNKRISRKHNKSIYKLKYYSIRIQSLLFKVHSSQFIYNSSRWALARGADFYTTKTHNSDIYAVKIASIKTCYPNRVYRIRYNEFNCKKIKIYIYIYIYPLKGAIATPSQPSLQRVERKRPEELQPKGLYDTPSLYPAYAQRKPRPVLDCSTVIG